MSVQTQLNITIISGDGVTNNSSLSKIVNTSFTGISEYYQTPQVIGVAAPAQPVCTPGSGGSMGAGNYLVKITYVNAPQGESLPSVESASATVSASGTLTVTSPAASSPATGYNIYITAAGGSTNTETKQNTNPIAIGTNYVQSAAVSSGATLPTQNTTLTYAMTLPVTPVQVAVVKNSSTSGQIATVSWTPLGGSSNEVIKLVPGGTIAVSEPFAGGGISAVSIAVSAVQASIDTLVAA